MSKLNLHDVLCGSRHRHTFIKELEVRAEEYKLLRNAQREIRGHVREGFRNLAQIIQPSNFHTPGFLISEMGRRLAKGHLGLKPKFLTQGSFAYKTVNWPDQLPPQQVDLDDGIYLPMPFMGNLPTVNSAAYFAVVERALEPLCENNGWSLVRNKSSCVRIQMDTNRSHVDLPLYGVPNDEFANLELEFAERGYRMEDGLNIMDILNSNRDIKGISSNRVMLATRRGNWVVSDPKSLNDWFEQSVRHYNRQIRRVCRYLKAWRDHRWAKCQLSSIALMALVVDAYEKVSEMPPPDRDDLALAMVTVAIVNSLQGPIYNPVFPGDEERRLDRNWSDVERQDFITKARELEDSVTRALHGTYRYEAALGHFQEAFGNRIPSDVTLVSRDEARAEVLGTQAATQPTPEVEASTSG